MYLIGYLDNTMMSFRIDDEKLLEKYKAISTNIKEYDDRYIKSKKSGLNVPEDDIECDSFAVISIDSLLVYESKYYLQIYLGNCAYKIVNKQMEDYLDDNLFED